MPAPARLYLFILIALLIILTPSGAPPHVSAPGTSVDSRLEALRNATFGHPPVNTTLPPAGLLELWAKTKTKIRDVPAGSIFRNATSSVQGTWSRIEDIRLPPPPENATDYGRNVTIDQGLVYLTIEDSRDETVRMTLRVKDDDGGRETHVGALRGVHFPDTGEMVAVGHGRIWELPFMMADQRGFNRSREVVQKIVAEGEEWEMAEDEYQGERCGYVVYVQLHPTQLDAEQIEEVERELRGPTGLRVPRTPRVVVSSLVYSAECRVLLASEMDGEKAEVFLGRVSSVGLGTAVITAVQMALLIRQMERSNTPSTQSRVSFWTIVLLAVVDGYFFLVFMVVAIYLEACFLPLAAASFFHLILLTMFEMRFLVSTYRVQRPERRTNPPPAPAPAASTDLPAPATATIIPPAAATSDPADELRNELGTLHTRFYFTLVITLFLTLHATSWPPFYRDMFLYSILAITNSYWVPQIYRNVMRGTRQPFAAEFIVGTSLCRFTVVVYLYLYPRNVFGVEPNPLSVALLAGWVWIQCCLLAGQAVLGGRFFIPRTYGGLPEVFDYHRPIDGVDEETGLLLQERSGGNCAVCMQSVEIPREGGGVLERRMFMVTPCRHVFHSECLEGWMRYKLECPVCRNALPAL